MGALKLTNLQKLEIEKKKKAELKLVHKKRIGACHCPCWAVIKNSDESSTWHWSTD